MSTNKGKTACIPSTSMSRSWREVSIEPFRLDLTSYKFKTDLRSQLHHRMRRRMDEDRLNAEGSVWEKLHAACEIYSDTIDQTIMRPSTSSNPNPSQGETGAEGDWGSMLAAVEREFERSSNGLSDQYRSILWHNIIGERLLNNNDDDNSTNDIESIIISKSYNKAQELWSQFDIIGLKKKDNSFSPSLAKGITTFEWSFEPDSKTIMKSKYEIDRTILRLENDIKGLKGLGPSYLRPTLDGSDETREDVLAGRGYELDKMRSRRWFVDRFEYRSGSNAVIKE
ncbi:uncharacterized protein L199_002034 [Kwoniella botswanensis]|uniref:uncharacterized protein n=1 Tax=Kwoniella botswanensis TaxID=1268659 RepID=UPI00315DE110